MTLPRSWRGSLIIPSIGVRVNLPQLEIAGGVLKRGPVMNADLRRLGDYTGLASENGSFPGVRNLGSLNCNGRTFRIRLK